MNSGSKKIIAPTTIFFRSNKISCNTIIFALNIDSLNVSLKNKIDSLLDQALIHFL
jgi:hypothetical protein